MEIAGVIGSLGSGQLEGIIVIFKQNKSMMGRCSSQSFICCIMAKLIYLIVKIYMLPDYLYVSFDMNHWILILFIEIRSSSTQYPPPR